MWSKRFLALLIGLMMIAGQAGFLSLDKVYAQEDGEDAHTVFVGSDRHGSSDNLVDVVNTAEKDVEERYGTTITKTVHAGDLVDSGDASSTYNSYSGLQAVNEEFWEALPELAEDGSDNFYTYGNSHDKSVTSEAVANHFLDSAGQSGSTEPTRDSGVVELGDWGYLWGIDHFEMSDTARAKGAAAIFTDWVNELAIEDHRVILIASHVPLHDRRGDNKGAAIWLDAINKAAEDNDIVFFWGHNHTGWNTADQNAAFVAPGGSITPEGGSATEIDFTYELAGYIGKSVSNAWRGSAITVEDDTIYVDHYSTKAHSETKTIERKDVETPQHTVHTWKTVKVAAGLLKNGKQYDQCTVCGAKKNVKTLTGYATYYVKSFKVSKCKRSFTAKWKKQTKANQKKFNGYQIRYSLKSNMSGAKYAKAAKSSKSKKIKKLKKKTRYYVQVRTYTVKNGKTFYSKWSAKKSVKTK